MRPATPHDPLGTILVRAAKAGTATRVKLIYPLVDDVPMTSELYEYIATDGADGAYGHVRMYAMDNGVARFALQFCFRRPVEEGNTQTRGGQQAGYFV